MNVRLKQLRQMLNKGKGKPVTQGQLVDALRLISAHQSLEAIVTCTYRIFELERKFPNILNHQIDDLAPRLEILKRISELDFADEHFKTSHLPKDSPCPLMPQTGDSPICDLLLLNRHDGTLQEEYEQVLAWFVWLAVSYHNEALKPERYEAYLLTKDGKPKLSSNKYSGRIAAAALHIRKLADSKKSEDLIKLVKLNLLCSEENGRSLARLAALVGGRGGIHGILNHYEREYKKEEFELAKERLITVQESVHTSMRFLWRLMWLPGTSGRSSPSHVSRQKQEINRLFGSKASRYGDSSATGSDNGGTLVVDVISQPKPPKERRAPKEAVEDEDDDDLPPKDPTYQLVYEDTDDLVQGYYAAKGAQYAIEYQNAQLPWAQHRLSQKAIDEFVSNHLEQREQAFVEDLTETKKLAINAKRAGKVLLGLSLVTGRGIDELRKAEILQTPYRWKNARDVQIDVENSTVKVKAGTPALTKKARAKLEGSRIFSPHGSMVSMKLPKFLKELLGDCEWLGEDHLRPKRYRRAADKLLSSLPKDYGYSRAGIRDALMYELLAQNKGDLGLVKLITDRNGLNYSNLIHYVSYPEGVASDCWAKAVSKVIGQSVKSLSLVNTEPMDDMFGEQTLGTPDAIDEAVLRQQIEKVQKQLALRIQEGAGIRVFNLMTLYTLLWLNLATASRGRVNPAPVAIIGNTALISDKHREDDSAERPVPLTEGVQTQMKAYVAYVWHLSMKVPQLKPLADSLVTGVLRFQFINNSNQVVNFRPKWLYESEALIPMPGNWARKYIQANLVSVGGRVQNSMQGHWVLGRHPYRVTSNFCPNEANTLWLEGQSKLEKKLGLRVMAHPDIQESFIQWPLPLKLVPPSGGIKKQTKENKTKAILKRLEVEEAFKEHAEGLYTAVCGTTEKVPAAVLSLILEVCKAYNDDIKKEIQVAKDCCDYVRREWKVAIYVNKPRRQFQKDWLIKRNAIANLAYLQSRGLPQFEAELAHLPPVEDDSHQIARFLMLLMWRQGLTTWPVINQFIEGFLQEGVKASAGLRYVPATIRCKRNGASMSRIIYLESYTSIYLAAEAGRLKQALGSLAELNPQQKRAKFQRLLAAYLEELAGVKTTQLLTTVLQAAQQYHLLNGSPLLAAYAAGEFETHDLPESELRHLLGLPPTPEVEGLSKATESFESTFRPEPSELPSADLARNSNPVHELATISSPDPNARVIRIQKLSEKGIRNKLLGHFAIWLHDKEFKLVKKRLPGSEKKRYRVIIEIVGYSLFGFCSEPTKRLAIDEALLSQIHSGFVDNHPNVSTKEAFGLFRKYLRQRGTVSALAKLSIDVGDVDPGQLQGVLSKMVLPAHQEQVIEALKSARSGIGSPVARESAINAMRIVGTFGLRRTEAINLRLKDIQTNLVRVQPHGDHTLKTPWSLRNLPIDYADKSVKKWLRQVESMGRNQVVSPESWVDGNQFFDPLNKLIQAITGDNGSHLHIVRHTVACQLLLSMLEPSVDFDAIKQHFPWLDQLLIPRDRLEVLLGNEGFSGHGIQAVSALMGHSHPTTTLRYYIHTVGIAQLAYLHTLPNIELDRAFEYRIKSPATMRRRQQEWRQCTDELSQSDRNAHIFAALKGTVDADVEQLDKEFDGFRQVKDISEEVLEEASCEIYFERFERLHSVLLGQDPNEGNEDLDAVGVGLKELSKTPTAKRGSDVARHPLVTIDGVLLPKPLPARSPTVAAAIFCDYLEQLRIADGPQLQWLIEIWRSNAQAKVVRVRLTCEQTELWESLPETESVKPYVESVAPERVNKNKKGKAHLEHYGRFHVLDERNKSLSRASGSVRWVMTWLCVTRVSS